ncbi:Arylsulfotransferase domain-containing protein [Trichoderma austrokoningii]
MRAMQLSHLVYHLLVYYIWWVPAIRFKNSDIGLATYISRPDLKPAVPECTTYRKSLVSPGSWFHAPFDALNTPDTHSYLPGQFGPHIFDNHGELIWSGALLFNRSNVYDFRKIRYRGSDALSLIAGDVGPTATATGVGFILNSSYEIVKTIYARDGEQLVHIDMHEFNVIDDGNSALVIIAKKSLTGESTLPDNTNATVRNNGFQEIETETNRIIFQWWAYDHVPASDSPYAPAEDVYHINSVKKTPRGHYLVSMRHQSTVFLISSDDGSIIWQLGGPHSSFLHTDGFNFSSQHDAQVYSQNETHTVISLLDNASDGVLITAECSSALLISLATAEAPMIATVIQKLDRPDGLLTDRRGNIQLLENENLLVSWSESGYTSEFSPNGILVQQVRSPYERFAEYRQYKFNWKASLHVSEPIAFSTHVYGATKDTATTVLYASWNGATEVKSWNFYSSESSERVQRPSLIAKVAKRGFETVAMITGQHSFIFVEAVSKDGTSLRNSTIQISQLPPSYVYEQQDHAYPAENRTVLNQLGMSTVERTMRYWVIGMSMAIFATLATYIVIRLWKCCIRKISA